MVLRRRCKHGKKTFHHPPLSFREHCPLNHNLLALHINRSLLWPLFTYSNLALIKLSDSNKMNYLCIRTRGQIIPTTLLPVPQIFGQSSVSDDHTFLPVKGTKLWSPHKWIINNFVKRTDWSLIHSGQKCFIWVACLWSKMPMFQREGSHSH